MRAVICREKKETPYDFVLFNPSRIPCHCKIQNGGHCVRSGSVRRECWGYGPTRLHNWFQLTKLHGITWQNGNLEMMSFNFEVLLNDTTKFDASKFPVTSLHINLSPVGLTLLDLLHCTSCFLQENTWRAMCCTYNATSKRFLLTLWRLNRTANL